MVHTPRQKSLYKLRRLRECGKCHRHFSSKQKLRDHKAFSHGRRKTGARDGINRDSRFAPKQTVARRTDAAPNKSRSSTCPKCHKTFSKHSYLKIHDDTVHLRLRPFSCDPCGLTFTQSSVLYLHMRKKHGRRRTVSVQQKKSVVESDAAEDDEALLEESTIDESSASLSLEDHLRDLLRANETC